MSCGSIYPTDARCSRLAQPVCFAQFIDLRWLLHKTTPPTMEETTVLLLKGGDVHTNNTYKPHIQPLRSDNNADCMLSMHACIYIHALCTVQNIPVSEREDMTWRSPLPFAYAWFPLAHILHIPEWGHQVLWFHMCYLDWFNAVFKKREAKTECIWHKINAKKAGFVCLFFVF